MRTSYLVTLEHTYAKLLLKRKGRHKHFDEDHKKYRHFLRDKLRNWAPRKSMSMSSFTYMTAI